MSDLTVYNETLGQQAFNAIAPKMEALEPGAIRRVALDLRLVSIETLKLSRLIAQPEIKALFLLLPDTLFAAHHAQDLTTLAWAVWYTHAQGIKVEAQPSKAQVPVLMAKQSVKVKTRMMKVASYHLDDHPTAGPELVSIRAGQGYLDLASDLSRVADLYDTHKTLLALDTHHYNASDAETARRLAAEILRELGSNPSRKWADRQARSWTLLVESYNEVRDAGQFIFRNDPQRRRLFSSLFSVARRGQPSASSVQEDVGENEGVDPALAAPNVPEVNT